MHIHILGICGTFMGSLAVLAKDLGFKVTGSDLNAYPPISDQLEDLNIEVIPNYDIEQLRLKPDLIVIGNVMSRGMPIIEEILRQGLAYTSGPLWLKENVLTNKKVIAISGTHGKTTTASLITFLLKEMEVDPGFLIGGVSKDLKQSSNIGRDPIFIIEADEYDTAFFDKRSKFIHYKPDVLLINNIEFDHADIFKDIDQIIWQFHQLLRTLSSNTTIVANWDDHNIQQLFKMGVWSGIDYFSSKIDQKTKWACVENDQGQYNLFCNDEKIDQMQLKLLGEHNMMNLTAAIAVLSNLELDPKDLIAGAKKFTGVKRRLEYLGQFSKIDLFDDFAHHPTSIKASIAAVKSTLNSSSLYVVVELASNTMRKGSLKSELKQSFVDVDYAWILDSGNIQWDIKEEFTEIQNVSILQTLGDLPDQIKSKIKPGDSFIIMTNSDSMKISNILKNR